MTQPDVSGWEFVDDAATFRLQNPHRVQCTLFPIMQ
jgi:hypothetical protein